MSPAPSWAAWTILLPLLGAVAAAVPRVGRVAVGLASLGTIAAAGATAWTVRRDGAQSYAIGGWDAPLGIELRVDGLASALLFAFAIVTALVILHVGSRWRPGKSRRHFLALTLFALAALDALVLSADVFNLYVTIELVTLVAVALVVSERRRAAIAAGLRYLLLSLAGSTFYLVGVALLYGMTATLHLGLLGERIRDGPASWAAFATMAVGLALKAGAFPMHAFIPPAYVRAPSAASALLSGLIGKAPYLLLLRLWVDVFSVVLRPLAGDVLGALGAASVLWCSVMAVRQRRLKGRLAYSSLAHVGYLFLFFPVGSSRAYAAAAYFAISHAVASASAFMAAGAIEASTGRDDLAAVDGFAHVRPVTFFALALACTSLVGLPPSGGFLAKWMLARAAFEQGTWWWGVVVLGGGLLAAAYVFPILRRAFLPAPTAAPIGSVSRGTEIATFVLASTAIALGLAPLRVVSLLSTGAP